MVGNETCPVSERLVSKLADRKNTTPVDLRPPLYDAIDLEALDALFAARSDGVDRVEFDYDGYRVRVAGDGGVTVSRPGETAFEFDCAFCDAVIEAAAVETIKDSARSHLEDNHGDALTDVFAVAFSGRQCRNDCGYTFPDRLDEVTDFDCPACGHDNFPAFVRQYVYWRIEKA
ncbi:MULTISPECIES: HalOD1 output domain-containing protein [Halorussus]|uniref:HalOD1 output domain-containing protein n=1 Tax=Halorussus TaxID=1070314 RepID=UPI0013B397F6|nr:MULTISPECIES: HalOD1 output domain-containing protein [Halorussus]NHN60198.1 hypothetical protein [Halorussus sp. JP-T4]